ncbi:hypothetical protein BCR42DRAFT_122146 [Absidia repens]|uniref:BHLH domain-containing protein n=1 Tax=Absidia repens TaxID=90262 RepID=A0A1X2I4J9_9FUNG|nr:hypothetical protein BCR42DRAFT_122146 [Absidia repens]
MYDHRRDSISSSLGTPSRRGQSKAEKRAEHNAIERARREGLNTRFQQLAHVLPNLHHDTRPSKGTIIERTLDFVKDAIQKEERYRHEIKDLRHTNRQLLKQLTHLTTGQVTNGETMDSDDDQVSVRSPSPSYPPTNTSSMPITRGSSPSSLSSGSSSPRPTSTQPPPFIRTKQKAQSQHALSPDSSSHQVNPILEISKLEKPHHHQEQRHHHRHHHHTTDPGMTQAITSERPASLRHAASLSSFCSENWQPSTPNAFWPQQTTSSIQSPSVLPFHISTSSPLAANSSPASIPHGFSEADLFSHATQTSSSTNHPHLAFHSGQGINATASQEDIDMKPCDFNLTLMKNEHQHTFMPPGYPTAQGPMRLSSRPSQSLSQFC